MLRTIPAVAGLLVAAFIIIVAVPAAVTLLEVLR